MNILVVDDLIINRKLLCATLEAEGHSVVQAQNGLEALEVLAQESVDAIISDILMPKMDGYRFCHELRRSEKLKHIAFIHYTSTYTSPGDRQLSKTVGADNYLVKPTATKVLLETLDEAMRHATERRASVLKDTDTAFAVKEYSVVLVKKLEEKNQELEQAMSELRRTHEVLAELNDTLEHRVQERTAELEAANRELARALSEVKELSAILPICSYCKKIRDDKDYWHNVESYISAHTDAKFSHGYCPECEEKIVKPEMEKFFKENGI